MPDSPWLQSVINRFNTVPPNPRENDFHGPYNKLLNTSFPADSDFRVTPKSYPLPQSRNIVDFIVEYEVTYQQYPVLILEIQAPGGLRLDSAREEADVQVRSRLRDLRHTCPLPTLHAVSAFGTRLSFYKYQGGRILPPGIARHPDLETDFALLARWDCDVLEGESTERLKAVFQEIIEGCEKL